MPEKVKNALHHWWPRSLSKFWADESGHVYQLSYNGQLVRSFPKNFGATRNAHNITFDRTPTDWDMSFESAFGSADAGFPSIVAWLRSLSSPIPASTLSFAERLTPLGVKGERHASLSECLASLIVRSPNYRYRIQITTEYFLNCFGGTRPTAPKHLVASNIYGSQQRFSKELAAGGKFAFLLSGELEFAFGDGFFHNFSLPDALSSPRCLVPITPEIAIFYTRPRSYRTYPTAFVMNLRPDEVSFINRTVQIYARRFLFFRDNHPIVDDEFNCGKHLQYEYHKHPWIEELRIRDGKHVFPQRRSLSCAVGGVGSRSSNVFAVAGVKLDAALELLEQLVRHSVERMGFARLAERTRRL